jgi:hypothetical protein
MFVIADAAARTFKGRTLTARKVSRERYLLEGSFRLIRSESKRCLRDRRANPKAFDFTMRGAVYSAEPGNHFSARALFEQAVERAESGQK